MKKENYKLKNTLHNANISNTLHMPTVKKKFSNFKHTASLKKCSKFAKTIRDCFPRHNAKSEIGDAVCCSVVCAISCGVAFIDEKSFYR